MADAPPLPSPPDIAAVRIHGDPMKLTPGIESSEVFGLVITGVATLVLLAIFVAMLWRATPWVQ